MERKIDFAPGEYYHIYNRGVDKREIFLSDDDRNRFIKLLFVANGDKPFAYKTILGVPLDKLDRGEQLVDIGAYCLMPNHFHLLVRERKDGHISSFMEKLGTSYAMYFNKKYKRSGVLFQNTFKAQHVDDDEYLKYLYAYIHLNPVKLIEPEWKEVGIQNLPVAKKYLEKYRFSSYADYAMEERAESAILTPSEFPDYFEDKGDFDHFVKDWLDYKDEKENSTTT
jgi:putative transposase